MTAEALKAIMTYLRARVTPASSADASAAALSFQTPTSEEMIAAGLDSDGVHRILAAPWWDEMVEDIIDTPDMCDPDDAPGRVLEYARDVVSEYIYKRFPLEET